MVSATDTAIVLIAGQPKAGTTSLFDWLAQHPQIATAKLKEVRFFLDADYPLPCPARFNGSNLTEFYSLYGAAEGQVLLDASPDYIGCETPLSLPQIAPGSKAILVIREPVERMVSAYRFYRARGHIPSNMSFDEYVARQHAEGVGPLTQSHMRALDHCRTAHYTARWRSAFGDDLLLLDFIDVKDRPQETLLQVLEFIGLDASATIEFSHGNKTRGYRAPKLFQLYNYVRRSFAQMTLRHPKFYDLFRPVGRAFVKRLEADDQPNEQIAISDETRCIILEEAVTD